MTAATLPSPTEMERFVAAGGTLYVLDAKTGSSALALICGKHRGRSRVIDHGQKATTFPPVGYCGCGPDGVMLNFWELDLATKAREFTSILPLPNAPFVTNMLDAAAAHATRWRCPAGCSLGLTLTFDLHNHCATFQMTHDDDCSTPDPVSHDGNETLKTGDILAVVGFDRPPTH